MDMDGETFQIADGLTVRALLPLPPREDVYPVFRFDLNSVVAQTTVTVQVTPWTVGDFTPSSNTLLGSLKMLADVEHRLDAFKFELLDCNGPEGPCSLEFAIRKNRSGFEYRLIVQDHLGDSELSVRAQGDAESVGRFVRAIAEGLRMARGDWTP